MSEPPEYYHNLSMRLSEVLDDIGINERIVQKRRKAWMLRETISTIWCSLNGSNCKVFHFGSQTEGSTTLGLDSDIDTLCIFSDVEVIQNLSVWQPDKCKQQLLIVQDETTSPGYCLLHRMIRHNETIQLNRDLFAIDEFVIDDNGRELLKHFVPLLMGGIRHGPAETSEGNDDIMDEDTVIGLFCSSWPKEAKPWLQQHSISGWPTEDIKRYAAENGCFLVPVASRTSVNQNTEWRISTSLAERRLMFSLNITQMRCYVLLKIIRITFVKPKFGDTLSSFMCKSVLFSKIANTRSSEWNDGNLIPCLRQCLQALLECVSTKNCPHFIIPENNLLAGKLTEEPVKQQLEGILSEVIGNLEQTLLDISVDQLGNRLQLKLGRIPFLPLQSSENITGEILAQNTNYIAEHLNSTFRETLAKIYEENIDDVYGYLSRFLYQLCQLLSRGSSMEQLACRLFAPILCTTIGSLAVSEDVSRNQPIETSLATLVWFTAGLNSDLSLSRLKLASAFYCAGNMERCEMILDSIERQLQVSSVVSVCHCYDRGTDIPEEFKTICREKNEEKLVKENVAFCLRFLPCEVNCIPKELRYEMFRSTTEDRQQRSKNDYWMDWAVVDALPYLYYMRYKVYSQHQRPAEQKQALEDLSRIITSEKNLGHKDTALNLLGQCMEHQNRMHDALHCYMDSIRVRGRNNAAKWYLCKLLLSLTSKMLP